MALTILEALALVAAAVALLVLIVVSETTRLWAAFTVAGFALLGAAVLYACARGIMRLRAAARSPLVLIQLLALPVAFSLGPQAGHYALGLPIMVVATAILVLLCVPAARAALER